MYRCTTSIDLYSYAVAIATLLCIANVNSYGDKSFSELHAMLSGDVWVGYTRLVASYAGKH